MVYLFKTPLPKAGQYVMFASLSNGRLIGPYDVKSTLGQQVLPYQQPHLHCYGWCLSQTTSPRLNCQEKLVLVQCLQSLVKPTSSN